MWITVLQFFVAIVLWIIAHKICENFPFEFMEKTEKDLKPYDYFDFYSTVYMLVILIMILIF